MALTETRPAETGAIGAVVSIVCRQRARREMYQISKQVVQLHACESGSPSDFSRAFNRKSAPRRRGPAVILNINGAGAAVEFQSPSFAAARYCVERKLDAKDAGVVACNPVSENSDTLDGIP